MRHIYSNTYIILQRPLMATHELHEHMYAWVTARLLLEHPFIASHTAFRESSLRTTADEHDLWAELHMRAHSVDGPSMRARLLPTSV